MNLAANLKPLKWIESAGGPLLLLERALLPYWQGSFGDGASTTDYDRACQVADYVGEIEVASGSGVVLGEEPFSTTWWQSERSLNGCLVRWGFAENEMKVREVLSSLLVAQHWRATDIKLEILNGELILFDSACSGTAVDDSLTITIPPGAYTVETLHYNPNDELSLILHRFVA